MNAPLPVTLIAGYLGAGKTTVVNHLLRNANGRRLAILVNEFGALPIDEDLIEAEDGDLISIAGGCICCSFGSDLTGALMELAALEPQPDHVLIEASGVAVPSAIAGTLALLDGYAPCGVCVLADITSLERLMADEYVGDTVERQLGDAGLIVLTKADLLEGNAAESVASLAMRYPMTTILSIAKGQLLPDFLLEAPGGSGAQPHGKHADQDYDSFVVTPLDTVDVATLRTALENGGYGIIRAKGFVPALPVSALIQVVGRAVDVTWPKTPGQMGVVFIGLKGKLDEAGIRALFQAHRA